MKIFETVTGSNQRFIQFHTVGKKEGAPMIWVLVNMKQLKEKEEDAQKYDPESRDSGL